MIEYSDSNPAEVMSRFTCVVCQDVVKSPKVIPCQHIFCQSCLKQWLTNSASCPLCRHAAQLCQAKSPPKEFKSDLSRLKVRCTFKEKGCSEEIELCKLKEHEKVCKFRGPKCFSTSCKRPLQNLDDSDEPGNKKKKFCCKDCLEDHAMVFYIHGLKRMKKWTDLAEEYKNCHRSKEEKAFFKRFSLAVVEKLQDVELKVTEKIRSQFSIEETKEAMIKRFHTLTKRLLDTITSHFNTLAPTCNLKMEQSLMTENSVTIITEFTSRFRGGFMAIDVE